MRNVFRLLFALLLLNLSLARITAQERKNTVAGNVMDTNHDPLAGARVELQPFGQSAVTDVQGQFKISDLTPGKYILAVSYVGFSDHPALLRQAPNNWNLDATYDKGLISARMGLTHNDANIFAYQFVDTFQGAPVDKKGPIGDQYLYPHTQVDAQVSYRLPHVHDFQAIASFLNLTNEVFGFYFGSEKYPIQREYYNRTYSFGLRWTPSFAK